MGSTRPRPTLTAGTEGVAMAVDWEYSVAFRVHHPGVDPAAVAAALGWQARWAWKAGQPRQDGAGRPLQGNYNRAIAG